MDFGGYLDDKIKEASFGPGFHYSPRPALRGSNRPLYPWLGVADSRFILLLEIVSFYFSAFFIYQIVVAFRKFRE